MKKILLTTSGIILLLLVAGVWYYLFLFGPPENSKEIFTNFGIGGNGPAFEETIDDSMGSTVDTSPDTNTGAPQMLQQLTTRPVAGMTFVSGNRVRYAELGTGHMYDINLSTGVETQVSNTTFGRVREVHFSKGGSAAVVTYEQNGSERVSVGTITSDGYAGVNLITGAYEAGFGESSSTLAYLVPAENGAEAYEYDLVEETTRLLFELPFFEVRVVWGDPTYIYTRPAATLLGYVYEIENGQLSYLTEGAFGLMATPFDGGLVITANNGAGLVSAARIEGTFHDVPLEIIPEKCVPTSSGKLTCGGTLDLRGARNYPDAWYKGVVTQSDYLWDVDIQNGEAMLISDPPTETGRILDVLSITTNVTGTKFLIINKNDNTLWIFEPHT